jgi:hypothetical protein
VIRVVLPYAVYGIEVMEGRVVDAAPIAHWMIGKSENYCKTWVLQKGGEWQDLDA